MNLSIFAGLEALHYIRQFIMRRKCGFSGDNEEVNFDLETFKVALAEWEPEFFAVAAGRKSDVV